jgi:hypothetical protein
MSRDVTMQIDTRSFDRALVHYAAATGKTLPEVANRAARNIAYRTVSFLPKADRGRIMSVATTDWWPKFIAKKISKGKGFSWTTGRKNVKQHHVQGSYTVAEARSVSKRLLSNRARSASFMKSGFAKAAQMFGEARAKPKSSLTRSQAKVDKARKGRAIADMVVSYISSRKGARAGADKRGKERIGITAMRKAFAFVTDDMVKYTQRELAKHARAVSAR